jgi:hypothetical protein
VKLRAFGAECIGKLLGVNTTYEGFIAEVVTLLSGEMPAAGEKCNNCEYFDKRQTLSI